MRRRNVWLILAVGVSLLASNAVAQLPLSTPADTGGWWHVAQALRPAVDRDGGPPARALALAWAELELGRAVRAVQIIRHTEFADSLKPRADVVVGTASFVTGEYATTIDVTTEIQFTSQGRIRYTTSEILDDCTTWFFAVTAYNGAGESDFSDEVPWLTPLGIAGCV